VKTTRHFVLKMEKRPDITTEMCERVVATPPVEEQQGNGEFRLWGYIAEQQRYLRVIVTEDRSTLVNAFWDRGFERRRR
jgi:hypothetical protein